MNEILFIKFINNNSHLKTFYSLRQRPNNNREKTELKRIWNEYSKSFGLYTKCQNKTQSVIHSESLLFSIYMGVKINK